MKKWWNKKLSSSLSLPSIENDVSIPLNINFGLKKHNNKYNIDNYYSNICINNYELIPDSKKKDDEIKINKNYEKKIEKINNSEHNKKTKEQKIKTIITKKNKSIENIDKITKSLKIKIQPTKEQKNILKRWFKECIKVYDFCINKYNNDKSYFVNMNKTDKIKIFNELYGEEEKPAPYDILTDEVRIFFSNLKSCQTNLKNGNIKQFELKIKNTTKTQSIFIPKTSIKKNGFYISHLKKMKGMDIKIDLENIGDSRILHDKENKNYYIIIPYYIDKQNTENKKRIIALDPGEKIFTSYYTEYNYGYIGKNIREKILPIEKKIRRYQRILSNKQNDNKEINNKKIRNYKKEKINKKGKEVIEKEMRSDSKLKNKKHIKMKIRKLYQKIKNIVKELHNKTAIYLVKNYEKIILPKFETQNIIKNKKKDKEYFNKIKREEGNERCLEEIKKVYKNRRLNGRVKFVLNSLSHYKFKMHLSHKCEEYGSELIDVTEEYTSKTCTKCGIESVNYSKNREKKCLCGYIIDRDINGARNIYIKNINKVVRSWETILPMECNKWFKIL